MIKDPNCKNKIWRATALESLIESKVQEILHSPELAKEIAETRKAKPSTPPKDTAMKKRIKAIDKKISKLMDLYQNDSIPTEVLGESINKLYLEKEALIKALTPEPEEEPMPFNLVEELLSDASQVWNFADEEQKHRILQSLINRIVIDNEDVKIEWAFSA